MIVRCEICFADIGQFDPDTLRAPLSGAMFSPLAAGYPSPFPEGAGFMDLLCPFCRKRAVGNDPADPERVHPGRLLTPDGPFEAPGDAAGMKGKRLKKGARANG